MSGMVKCIVWDLDNTLWDGTLLEGDSVSLKPGIREVIAELDSRGILQSVASRNDFDLAMEKLREFDLDEYFLYPQITWSDKSGSIKRIAELLNIGLDSMAFIDDRQEELAEVASVCKDVLTLDAAVYKELTGMDEFKPKNITSDTGLRRRMYMDDIRRKDEESAFAGSNSEFLSTLGMKLTLSKVREGDLERAEDLTLRTNQLNSTGITYDYEQLKEFVFSDNHLFLIAELEDRFGSYGKIALALAEKTTFALDIKLLLTSCRVMTRGVGSAMLVYFIKQAVRDGLKLTADFIDTGRNRVMYVTYKLMGFADDSGDDEAGKPVKLLYEGGAREYPPHLVVCEADQIEN